MIPTQILTGLVQGFTNCFGYVGAVVSGNLPFVLHGYIGLEKYYPPMRLTAITPHRKNCSRLRLHEDLNMKTF